MRREISIRKSIFTSLLLTLSLGLSGPSLSQVVAQPQDALTTSATHHGAAAITGRVTDPQGAGVFGATLTLYARGESSHAKSIATATDATGAYRFAQLAAPGEYLLEVEAAGFARSAARTLRVGSGAHLTLDLQLEVAGVSAEVVVTAANTAQSVDEVSKAVTVIGRREMDERDEFSIPEALRTVPGLRVQQLGGPGRTTSIRTRGLRTQDTAVVIDGLRFRDASTINGDASSFLSDFQVTNASRVEILRGSGSSLYGTNAIGGVVNVVTDEGGGPFHGNLLAEGGGLGFFRGRAQVAGSAGVGEQMIYSAGISHFNIARGIDRDDAARNMSGQGRILFRLTPSATLSGRIYSSDAFVQLNESPDVLAANLPASGIVKAVPLSLAELRRLEAGTPISQLNIGPATFIPDANDPDNRQASRFFSGALLFTQRFHESFGYTLAYQGLATKRTNRNAPAGRNFQPVGGATQNDFDGRIHTLNVHADFRLGDANLITAGYEFERETFINRSFPVNPSARTGIDVTERSQAFFIQDQVRLLEDRLQLSAAFRAQFFSLEEPRFSGAISSFFQNISFASPPTAYTGDGSVAYLFRATNTKLRAHVGNGYRAPSLFERFGASPFGALGDPRLRSERAIAFDVGIDQTLSHNRVRASATYFYTRLQEVVGFDAVAQPDPFGRLFGGYLNTGGGLARGVELSATLAPTSTLDVFTSYTYTNSDDRLPKFGDIIRAYVIPDHQFSLVATQRFGRRFLVNFDLSAASEYLAPVFSSDFSQPSRVYRFDGLIKADVGAHYTIALNEKHSLRIFGKVDNLFGRSYFENGFRTPGRTGVAGVAYSF